MEKISITEVLAEIRSGKEFSILYVRATKAKGSLKTLERLISGHNYKIFNASQRRAYEIKQQRGKHTLHGTIPVIDQENDEHLTLLISHIIGFNNKKVIH